MKKVLILGANGTIAKFVISQLETNPDFELIKTSRHENEDSNVLALDVLSSEDLDRIFNSHHIDIVYANFNTSGHQVDAAKNISRVMQQHQVKRLIWIATAGIYSSELPDNVEQNNAMEELGPPNDPTSYFGEQKLSVLTLENSELEYTILRPTILKDGQEVQGVIEQASKETLAGDPINRVTVANWVATRILNKDYIRQNVLLSAKP